MESVHVAEVYVENISYETASMHFYEGEFSA